MTKEKFIENLKKEAMSIDEILNHLQKPANPLWNVKWDKVKELANKDEEL